MKKNVCHVLILLAVLYIAICGREAHDLSCQSKTILTPHMESNIADSQNIVYCSTFQDSYSNGKKDNAQ
jgi:hypothetical protein